MTRSKSTEIYGHNLSDLYFPLEEAKKVLIQTRTNIHSFNIDYVDSLARPGFEAAQAAILGANKSMDESLRRRIWLFFFSLIITYLIITIGIKIKGLNRES
ncbi:MAG: hypothetical protein ACE5EE_02695 [Fidelibacterota bacterium]